MITVIRKWHQVLALADYYTFILEKHIPFQIEPIAMFSIQT